MKALVLKDDFEKQLTTTNGEISSLNNQIKALEIKREQLKGAVYALETLAKLEAESKSEDKQLAQPLDQLKKKT